MRIALIGSGGTGKTTLLHELNKHLKLPVISEGIRPWLKDHGFDDFKEMSLDDVREMQQDVMFDKMREEQSLTSFFSDRTTIDNTCYAMYWLGQKKEYSKWYQGYFNNAVKHFNCTYDIVIILPWGVIELENDGIRSSNKWYQFILQQMMENMVITHKGVNTTVIKVKSIPLDERVKECIYLIDKHIYMEKIK